MNTPLKILLVEDSEDDAMLALHALRRGGFDPTHRRVQTAAEVKNALAEERWDVVISDFSMPGCTGMDALRIFRSAGLDIPFILISGTIGEETAVDAMKAGARDYVMKKNLALLVPALERELKEAQLRAAHRRTQEALIDSEKRLRQLVENIRDAFFLVDADSNRMLYISPAYEEIWGRSCDSLYANPESWTEAIHPDDHASAYGKYKAGMSAGKFDCEYRIVRPDGSIRWIEARGFPVRDDAGKIVRISGVAEDITERKRDEQALMQLRRRSELILESVEEGIHGIDVEGRIVFQNPASAKMLGYSIEELSGRPAHATMHHSRKDGTPYPIAHCPIHTTMLDGGVRRIEDEVFWRKDGSSFPVEYTSAPIRNDRDEITGAVVAFRDIADRKEAENRIRRLNRVYAMLSGISTLIVRVRERDELFNEACQIAVDAGGFSMAWVGVVDPNTLDGTVVACYGGDESYVDKIRLTARDGTPDSARPACRALRQLQPVICNDIATDPSVAALLGDLLSRGHKSVGCFPLTVKGQPEAVIALFAGEPDVFDDEETRLLLELARNISFALHHIEKEEKLDYLAYYDVLTGLANRTLFLERVAAYMRSAASGGHKLALGIVDLERFKNINDGLGRPAGDALLQQVAEWLTRNLGDANLLARVDADHFAVVLPEVKPEGNLAQLLEKLMGAFLDHPFRLNDTVFRVAFKLGVALFPDDGADADTLFRNAEAALKQAKASGDRYLFHAQEMTATVAGKLTLENQLRQALDKEEFVLHYQPKISLVSGKLTGAEALIRWNDPRTGLVPPGRFIPILEETGLICDVGRWALRQAIEDYLRWRRAGLAAVRIAVNVSPLQLRHRGFVAEIRQAIGIDAQAPAGLELEITESQIMEDVKYNIASLQAIRAMGVSIAIDDFGTGFSSLSYLAKLPVDTLKIDRSFVIDMTAGPQGLALVQTIINLAHSLKLNVVAEGVETEEQSRFLQLLGCDEMQGFLIGQPVPGEIFETTFLAPLAAG